jgi:hypothetical protein
MNPKAPSVSRSRERSVVLHVSTAAREPLVALHLNLKNFVNAVGLLVWDCIKVGGSTLLVVEEFIVGTSELRQPLEEEHFEPIVEDGATNLEGALVQTRE